MKFGIALVLVVVASSLALPVRAADRWQPPRVGDRVRITLVDSPSTSTGRLLDYDATSLGIRLDAATDSGVVARRIPRSTITSLELDRSHGNAGLGALVGLAVGLTVGIVLAGNHETEGDSDYYVLGAVAGGLVYGTIGGAILGSQIREERWEPRPLPPAGDAPSPRGTTGAPRDSI